MIASIFFMVRRIGQSLLSNARAKCGREFFITPEDYGWGGFLASAKPVSQKSFATRPGFRKKPGEGEFSPKKRVPTVAKGRGTFHDDPAHRITS
jgi:hypothetical protein